MPTDESPAAAKQAYLAAAVLQTFRDTYLQPISAGKCQQWSVLETSVQATARDGL